MKFYFSAKWQLAPIVSSMIEKVRRSGHTVEIDWTKRASSRGYGGENEVQSRSFSEEEVMAILGSDIFVHLSDEGGKGKYVDLGIALAGNKVRGNPRIYVVGKSVDESQFYFNSSVQRIVTDSPLRTLEKILAEL